MVPARRAERLEALAGGFGRDRCITIIDALSPCLAVVLGDGGYLLVSP